MDMAVARLQTPTWHVCLTVSTLCLYVYDRLPLSVDKYVAACQMVKLSN